MSVALQVAILAMQIALILFSARFAGNAARKLHLPAVLGELLAGIIIGPYVLGQLCLPLHGFEQGIFPLTAGSSLPGSLPLYSLAAIGSIILLFMSGLETDLRQFFRYSVAGTAIGIGNAAIREILETLSRSHLLKESSLCEEAIFKRESITATTIHGGVALPHARTAGVSRLVSAIAVSREGIPTDTDQNDKTHLFVLTLAPTGTDHPYLQYISRVGKLLSKEENKTRILQAETAAEIRNIFIKHN